MLISFFSNFTSTFDHFSIFANKSVFHYTYKYFLYILGNITSGRNDVEFEAQTKCVDSTQIQSCLLTLKKEEKKKLLFCKKKSTEKQFMLHN